MGSGRRPPMLTFARREAGGEGTGGGGGGWGLVSGPKGCKGRGAGLRPRDPDPDRSTRPSPARPLSESFLPDPARAWPARPGAESAARTAERFRTTVWIGGRLAERAWGCSEGLKVGASHGVKVAWPPSSEGGLAIFKPSLKVGASHGVKRWVRFVQTLVVTQSLTESGWATAGSSLAGP